MMPVTIRPYRPERDATAVFQLWQVALGREWPLTLALFRQVIESAENLTQALDHFIAVDDRTIVGFAATYAGRGSASAAAAGSIIALVVTPQSQWRGIGSTLHDAALQHLRDSGVRRVQLGGGGPRFWPGVPADLSSAIHFFQRHSWEFSETSYDMVQTLQGYSTPPKVYQRLERQRVALRIADEQDLSDILAFVAAEFPEWLDAYRSIAGLGDYDDILLAHDAGQRLVGALVMYTERSNPQRGDVVWQTLLGDRPGALGVVGVAEDARRLGIGSALVARSTELLKARGAAYSFIGWTWALDFYGKLGYTTWRAYEMSWRDL
jgi:beta-N-acetylhexosaminidase